MAAVTLLSSLFNTTNGSKTTAGATPAVGDLIVIIAAHTGNTTSVAPTDSKGGKYEAVTPGLTVKNSSADSMQIWIRTTPISSATSTTFTHSPGTTTGGGLFVLNVSGMKRTGLGAVRLASGTKQFASQDNQASGTPGPSFPSAGDTNNPCIGAVFSATNSTTTQTPPTSWTERFDNGYATPATGMEVCSRDSGNTSSTITWGAASGSAFCSAIVELDTTDPGLDLSHKEDFLDTFQYKARVIPTLVLGANLLLTTLAPIPNTEVTREPLYQSAKVPGQVRALTYPNLSTSTLDTGVVASPFVNLPHLVVQMPKRILDDTSAGIPKVLFEDIQQPVGSKQTHTIPDRIRPVWDTSKGIAKTLFTDSVLPFGNPPSSFIPRIRTIEDTSTSSSPVLIPIIATAPFVPYDFSNVQKPKQLLPDTSRGLDKNFIQDAQTPVGSVSIVIAPAVERHVTDTSKGQSQNLQAEITVPFIPAPHLGPQSPPRNNVPWIWRPEGAPDPAPQEQPIGAKALQQVPAWKPSVWAQNNAIPPDRIPEQPATPIPEGKQSLTFSPHKKPQVFAEQHYIPPYLIVDSSIASAYPESQVIVRKPPRTLDTSFRNRAILEAIVPPPIVPWNFEEPQKVKWNAVDTTYRNATILDTVSPLPNYSWNFEKPQQPRRDVVNTSYRNSLALDTVVVNPTIPWNFEKPQLVRRDVVNTSLGTPKTLISDAQLPVGQPTPQSFIAQKKWQSVIQSDYRNWAIFVPEAVTYTITPSGGIVFSGTSTYSHIRTDSVSGSITFSGTNEFTHIKTYLPTGAITFSGNNSMLFLPFGSAIPTTKLPMTGAGQT